ncbi:MAG TPA: hypothetical protein VN893_06800, partial [Bryobacteraceae bacterium]|nr:hypothetical protein [Bryobacteraceae bacterium]
AAVTPGTLPAPQGKSGASRPLPKHDPGDDPAVLSLAAALLPPPPPPPAPTAPVAAVGDGASGAGGAATADQPAASPAGAANLPGPVAALPSSSAQEALAELAVADLVQAGPEQKSQPKPIAPGPAAPQNLTLDSPVPQDTAPENAILESAAQAAPAPDPVAGRNSQLAFGIRLTASALPATPQPASATPSPAQGSVPATPGHNSAADATQAPGPTPPPPVEAGRSAAAAETARSVLGQGTSNQPPEPENRHPLSTASAENGSAVAVPVAAPATSLEAAATARENVPQTAAPPAPAPPPTPSEPPREPAIHELSLALSGPSVNGRAGEQVSLRVVERGGEVQVAVRTADPQLAGDLRQNLPDLVSELSGRGYRAETWQPLASSGTNASVVPRAASTAADSSAGQSYSGQTGGGSRNSGSAAGQQQQQQRHGQDPNQPSWLQALTRGAAQTGSTPYDDYTR